ncbi:MAG TPA: hypothetical protein VL285_17640 [Bryobacteraceae bacterium]|nr:hypothetical protein [Bryobacteraceae bacterium]
MSRKRAAAILAAIAVLMAAHALADLDGSYVLPLDDWAIQYSTRPVDDPIARLQQRIRSGDARLEYDPDYGYLPSVLRNLGAPVSSQILVFSKTSFQAARISPRVPRALYFNDQVSVGWVKGGDVVEVASVDPKQGVIFYTLNQEKSSSPKFVRRDECLQCHASGNTLGVPGLVVRSVFPDAGGMPLFHVGTFITDHRSPLSQRWGGYYVTGTHGEQQHMGNLIYEDGQPPRPASAKGTNVTDLKGRLDTGGLLSPGSDIVALMTLEHQSRMQNLITRVGFETRMALESQAAMNKALKRPEGERSESTVRRIHGAAEALVKYMLFTDEAPLEGRIEGTSGFAAGFAAQGPKDRQGRSLRQFELTRRMFRYPCSYLIYSEAFDNLPPAARDRIYRRLWEVLTGEDRDAAFARLSAEDRRAILEILLDTKKGLPDYWRPISTQRLHGTTPASGLGESSSIESNSSRLPSGSWK